MSAQTLDDEFTISKNSLTKKECISEAFDINHTPHTARFLFSVLFLRFPLLTYTQSQWRVSVVFVFCLFNCFKLPRICCYGISLTSHTAS